MRAVISGVKVSGRVDVLEYADYYALGGVARSGGTLQYRHGYQGQYAEKDGETGWNSFELRQYDAVIGRWLSPDPYGQYNSPYVGMGNDWPNAVDPDGGFADPVIVLTRAVEVTAKAIPGASVYLKSVGIAIARNAVQSPDMSRYPDLTGDYPEYSYRPSLDFSTAGRQTMLMNAFGGMMERAGDVFDRLSSPLYMEGTNPDGSVERMEIPIFPASAGRKGVVKIAIKFFKAKRIVNIVVDSRVVWASASEAYRNSTRLGHSLSKHANRPGGSAIWGKLKGHISTWHDQASKHYNDIMSAPGGFRRVPNEEGIIFLEKRLPDGRGLRLNRDQTFKGFID